MLDMMNLKKRENRSLFVATKRALGTLGQNNHIVTDIQGRTTISNLDNSDYMVEEEKENLVGDRFLIE